MTLIKNIFGFLLLNFKGLISLNFDLKFVLVLLLVFCIMDLLSKKHSSSSSPKMF